jgi:hypothetical protein
MKKFKTDHLDPVMKGATKVYRLKMAAGILAVTVFYLYYKMKGY